MNSCHEIAIVVFFIVLVGSWPGDCLSSFVFAGSFREVFVDLPATSIPRGLTNLVVLSGMFLVYGKTVRFLVCFVIVSGYYFSFAHLIMKYRSRVTNIKVENGALLAQKLNRLTSNKGKEQYDPWIKNLTGGAINGEERSLLVRGLLFNIKDDTKREYLAEVE